MIDYGVRLLVFMVFFFSLIAWQVALPKVAFANWRQRWRNNLSLFGIDVLVVRLLQPLILGLFAFHLNNNAPLHLSWLVDYPLLSMALCIVILDMAIYWQHRAAHLVPFLWRLHQVHHSDAQIDVSTAVRFHPLEIALSLVYKGVIIYLFAIPVEAVLLFDILLNASAMFNHTNGKLSPKLDGVIRRFIVTPDMHRIHHSTRFEEANSNFGFFLSCWDRWFGSYTAAPENGEQSLETGLPSKHEKILVESLPTLLNMPFQKR